MEMKQLSIGGNKIAVVIAIILFVVVVKSGFKNIAPGHVGIKVNNFGGNKGVQDITLTTGVVFYLPFTTTVFEYPTFVQTGAYSNLATEGRKQDDSVPFNTKDGVPVHANISFSYQLLTEKVPNFYVKFRTDNLDSFTYGFLFNVVRDAFNKIGSEYQLDDLNGPKKEELLARAKDKINADVIQYGVQMVQFGFIGALQAPPEIMQTMVSKTRATQAAIQAENEKRVAIAEAQKRIETARGEAEANRLLNASITPTLIEWRRLELQQKAIDKWNGARPMVEGGNQGLLLQIPVK